MGDRVKICVYAICKNESAFAERWVRSASEADEIVALDTGSADDTVERLKELGVRVFQKKIEPWRFDTARNQALELVSEDTDVCVCPDLDEFFHPGWREALERAWKPGTTRAAYRYTWNFNADGSEGCVFWADKIHARHGYRWRNPVHEVLEWTGAPGAERRVTAEGVQLDHRADPAKSRSQYLPLLELSVQERPEDDRGWHYLGREYMFYSRWSDAIQALKHHLSMPQATWADERSASMRFIARCCVGLGQTAEAERWYLRAIAEAPRLREGYVELARLRYEQAQWEDVACLTGRAVAIEKRPRTYINDSEAWGSLPWDLRSLGLFYTGRPAEALRAAEEAAKLAPDDERIRKNVELIRSRMQQDGSRKD